MPETAVTDELRAVRAQRDVLQAKLAAETLPLNRNYGPCVRHAAGGMHSYAEEPYEHGDSEPCVHCRDGTARVMTTEEAALSERTRS